MSPGLKTSFASHAVDFERYQLSRSQRRSLQLLLSFGWVFNVVHLSVTQISVKLAGRDH